MNKLLAILLICVSVSVFAQDKAKSAGYTRVTLSEGSGFEVYTTTFPPRALFHQWQKGQFE